jgi:hypothetical protein
MRKVFAGAIFYELTEESNNYGLIQNPGQQKLLDYTFFKNEMAKIKEADLAYTEVTEKKEYSPACPEQTEYWSAVSRICLFILIDRTTTNSQ